MQIMLSVIAVHRERYLIFREFSCAVRVRPVERITKLLLHLFPSRHRVVLAFPSIAHNV